MRFLGLDRWGEVLETLRRNRLRTALTALAVAWGIFMLILLLAAGEGLHNNVRHQFRDDAVNSIWVHGGQTSLPYRGLRPNRQIRFENGDYDAIRDRIDGVERLTGRFYMWGEFAVSYGDKTSTFDVRAVHPDHRFLEKTQVIAGRYLNPNDVRERRKVAVIGKKVMEFFFADADPIGEVLDVRGMAVTVIGVFDDVGGEREQSLIYIPVSTAQRAYSAGDSLHGLMMTVDGQDIEHSREVARAVTELLAERHDFDPEDPRALRLRNNLEDFERFDQIFRWIRLFFWIVGIGTIVAGIVGVSNIMLISVSERTREFGLRKAIGATPWSIVSTVVQESLILTSISGYLGLVAGVGLVELVNRTVPENDYFRQPEVDIGVALIAVALLVVFGAIAGYVPARRAARVSPVDALRDE